MANHSPKLSFAGGTLLLEGMAAPARSRALAAAAWV